MLRRIRAPSAVDEEDDNKTDGGTPRLFGPFLLQVFFLPRVFFLTLQGHYVPRSELGRGKGSKRKAKALPDLTEFTI